MSIEYDDGWQAGLDATNQAVQKIASDLPDDWQVILEIERGSGLVRLYDPNGDDQMIELDEGSIAEQLLAALRIANERAPEFPGG